MTRIAPELALTLAAVVDEGTLDAAAARLHITPSAVSQRIRALEEQLGVAVAVQRLDAGGAQLRMLAELGEGREDGGGRRGVRGPGRRQERRRGRQSDSSPERSALKCSSHWYHQPLLSQLGSTVPARGPRRQGALGVGRGPGRPRCLRAESRGRNPSLGCVRFLELLLGEG